MYSIPPSGIGCHPTLIPIINVEIPRTWTNIAGSSAAKIPLLVPCMLACWAGGRKVGRAQDVGKFIRAEGNGSTRTVKISLPEISLRRLVKIFLLLFYFFDLEQDGKFDANASA